jgi:nucleoside-diphosphate-sugar epimerase
MKKILITGHRGFVGRHFMKFYENDQDTFITGIDLTDGLDVRHFCKHNREKYDLVVHLAAIVGGRTTIEGSPLAVATDLSIDAEVFNWALTTKPEHFVYFSSSAAYPTKLQTADVNIQLKEDMIDLSNISNPDLTYGWAKLTGEYLAQFLENSGVKVHIFRPFSGYGTDQSLQYPFPMYIERAKKRDDPFEIWGDGTQTRDFIHIKDIVKAVHSAIKQDVKGPTNLGWGIGTSFNELAALVASEVGYSPEFHHIVDAPIGVINRVANPEKLFSFYKPQITLEEGIRRALKGIVW